MSGESGFSVDWLRMREPWDHAARSAALGDAFAAGLPDRAVTLLDLGAGLGSNVRWLAPRVRRPQRWVLVDHDPALIAAGPEAMARWAAGRGWSATTRGDALVLGSALEVSWAALDLRTAAEWPDADAVTTQALLDLCDEPWLHGLARRLGRRPLLAALSVDGRVRWEPGHPDDELVNGAFRAHQTRDKPGTRAGAWLAGRLAADGHRVRLAESDWWIRDDPGMLLAMVGGTRDAAAEGLGDESVAAWYSGRSAQARRGELSLRVGHVDLYASPGS